MTFSMTFPSFPWPMLSSCSQSIVKTIYYLRYFPTLSCVKCLLVFIFAEIKILFSDLSVIFSTFDIFFFVFLFSESRLLFHDFPWPILQFHDFPGLENEITKFHDFPGFPWPVWTLLITLMLTRRHLINIIWLCLLAHEISCNIGHTAMIGKRKPSESLTH